MKRFLLALFFLAETAFGQMSTVSVDQTGEVGLGYINRQDASTTVSSSGNGSTLDTQGLSTFSFTTNVTAISGTGANIQFHLQYSDDSSNWTTIYDTPQFTATGFNTYTSIRVAPRYYRYTWTVAGSTPSVTFTIQTTIKQASPSRRNSERDFYADINLTALNNVSSTFMVNDCANVGIVFVRGADGGNNANVQIQASNDNVNFVSISSNVAVNVSTVNDALESSTGFRFMRAIVTTATSAGTRTADLHWSCN